MSDIDTTPTPRGKLALQTVAMPKDTNATGDIFGGWLLSQMDIAALITAGEVANGRAATVAIDSMTFLTPVHVGAVVSCYCDVLEIGPGPGGLTRALLLEGARRVVAIERDGRCLPALEEISAAFPGRLDIVEGDAQHGRVLVGGLVCRQVLTYTQVTARKKHRNHSSG
jgi:acyl-coenzyme A thioesterase PaaI-like protein